MKRLKRLQEQYKDGKINKSEYEAAVAELLEDELIDQGAHDEAIKLEVEGNEDDKLIYSQADVDKIILKKSTTLVKKAMKDAGVDIPKGGDVIGNLAEILKAGEAAGMNDSDLAKENARLTKELEKTGSDSARLKKFQRENAVLSVASEFNPHNPSRVVAALDDYEDLLDYDDDGNLDKKSVRSVMKKLAKAEPYMFKTTDADGGAGGEGGDDAGKGENDKGVKGKGPGGGAGGAGSNTDEDAKVNEALALMGRTVPEDKK